jgi:hypothetical protein
MKHSLFVVLLALAAVLAGGRGLAQAGAAGRC